MVLDDPREHLVGGEVQVLPQPKHPEYGDVVLTPRETRALFAEKGFERVVAFQTRNPLHRAHEYALVVGLERLTREGHFAGAVLNPLIGETKGDDVDAATRMRTYRALIDNKVLGAGRHRRGAVEEGRPQRSAITSCCLGLDIKMFYAGPKEAVMHAIYRQNFGFTDIVIGRKHADAPYDDGKDIWDGLAAQRKFDELKGDLLIKPVKVGFAAFYDELGRVGLVDEHAPKGWKPVSITGRELREKLRARRTARPADHAAGDGQGADRADEEVAVRSAWTRYENCRCRWIRAAGRHRSPCDSSPIGSANHFSVLAGPALCRSRACRSTPTLSAAGF